MTDHQFKRVMAVDFGLKRIGIALSDPLKTFAIPFTTLANDLKLFSKLAEIIEQKNVELILLGIPERSVSSDKSVYDNVIEFRDLLLKQFNIPVLLWNETHTSKIAERKVIESVKSKKKRKDKGLIDMHSAAIILSEYLDSLKR